MIFKIKSLLLLLFLTVCNICLLGQQTGDYRSRQDGCFEDATTWEIYNGSAWVDAGVPPNQNPNIKEISIEAPDQVIICESKTLKRLVIQQGAKCKVSTGIVLSIAEDSSSNDSDLIVKGELFLDDIGTTLSVNSNTTTVVEGGGKIVTQNNASLILAVGSVLLIKGIFEIAGIFRFGQPLAIFSITGLGTLNISSTGKLIVNAVTVSFAAFLESMA